MDSKLAENFPWTTALARLIWPEGPARRKRWVILAAAILLLVAAHTLWASIASARLNRVTERVRQHWGPMALSDLAPAAVDDPDNAAKPIRAAGELLQLPGRGGGTTERDVLRYGSYDAGTIRRAELDDVREAVEENTLALGVLDEAVDRPAANWGIRYARGVEAPIPNLLQVLHLAKLNVASGRLALRDGRTPEVVRAIERGAAIERSFRDEPAAIMQAVRPSLQRYPTALLRDWLSHGELDEAVLAPLAGAWADRGPDHPLGPAFAGEAMAMVAALLDGRVDDGGSSIVRHLGALARPVVIDNARVYLELMDRVVTCATHPRHERDPFCAGSGGAEEFGWYHAPARAMVFNFRAMLDRTDVADARASLATLAIALERHRLRHGSYPDALGALVPEWIEAVPADPLTGGALAYARTGDGYMLKTEAALDDLLADVPAHDPVLEWSVGSRAGR